MVLDQVLFTMCFNPTICADPIVSCEDSTAK